MLYLTTLQKIIMKIRDRSCINIGGVLDGVGNDYKMNIAKDLN